MVVAEQEVIIVNPESFEEIKKKIKKDGTNKFHVLADFDRTITYGLTPKGKRTETVISQLRSNPKYLGQEYVDEAHRLFDKYHPIEVDPNVPLDEKINKMHEWWKAHFDLIAKVGLTKQLIKQVVKEKPLKFRQGSLEFFNFLKDKSIPLIFMSAAPGDMVLEYLEENNLMHENVLVIANKYKFDEQGKALEVQEPIIHTFNKTEISLKDNPKYSKFEKRKNVLLLGDSLGDIGMIKGFDYNNLIKIGFLNENVEEQIEEFKKSFDVVLTGDQDFDFVNKLVKEILNDNHN